MPTIGYSSNQGWGFGYSHNGNSNLYYPSYNYNAPEQAAERAYNNMVQSTNWQFYAGLGASAASEVYFSNKFGTWMGKNFKVYDQNWGGNGYTGGKYKFAQSTSKLLSFAGKGAGIWGMLNTGIDYYQNEIGGSQFLIEEGSSAYSTFGGIYGAAWGIGWETGRYITKQSWYQRAKFQIYYNWWQIQHGKPSYRNRYDWEYFFNNYKP
jgi:hypothetical protein